MSAPSPAPAAAGALLKSIDSLNSRSKNSLRFTNSDGKLRSSGLEILVEDERRMRVSPEVIKLNRFWLGKALSDPLQKRRKYQRPTNANVIW